MFKSTVLALGLVSAVSYNVSDAFHTVKDAALDVSGVYAAAAQIDPYAPAHERNAQNDALFAAADNVRGLATHMSGLELDENDDSATTWDKAASF